MPHARYRPHPGLILTGWALFAVVLQRFELRPLALTTLPVFVLAAAVARARFLKLLRRSRFLMLALFLIYAMVTPGERLPYVPEWLPLRREGCELAFLHMLGLAGMLAALALLLEYMSLPRLIAGLYSVSLPLGLIGIARDRAALRLLLVLDGLQQRPGLGWREWLTPEPVADAAPVRIERSPWSVFDYCLLAFLVAATFAAVHQ